MKGTILIVDDNREIVVSLGKLLAIEGYEILTAYDGMEALSVLEKSQPDPAGRDDAAAERTFGSDENSREPQYSGDHAFCQNRRERQGLRLAAGRG